MRYCHRIEGVIVDINGEGEVSGLWVASRFRVRCSISGAGESGLQLDFCSSSDVRASARMNFRFKVKCG